MTTKRKRLNDFHNTRCLVCPHEKRFNPEITLYRIPEQKGKRDLWLKNIAKSELINTKLPYDIRICEKHFDKKHFSTYSKRLRKDAAPINLNIDVDVEEYERIKNECVRMKRQINYLNSTEFFIQRCRELLPPQLAQIAENHLRHPGVKPPVVVSHAKVTVVGIPATK